MSKDAKFFVCKHCGNIITFVQDAGVKVSCCGDVMDELVPGTVEASYEKHIPDVTVDGSKVTVAVGSVAHPMLEEHHIAWVYLKTNVGGQIKYLKVGAEPVAVFQLSDGEKAEAAFEYCNLHGLWKADI